MHGQKPEESQTSQATGDVVRISTELVQTDVTVFDRQGRFVDDLRREQFELRVDGKAVPISFFERVGASSAPASKVAVERASNQRRKIVFFLDDLHLAADSIEQVRKSLLQFIDSEVGGNDEVAIVAASGRIGFLQQFTDHKAVMRAAVARIKYRSNAVQDTGSLPMTEYIALRISQGDRDALNYYTNELLRSLQFQYSLPKYGGKGAGYMAGSESDQAERMVMQRAQAMMTQSAANSTATLSALESFLRSSAQTPGRKHVLFISDGFFMLGNPAFAQKMERITDAAARSGSVIYTVNARAFAERSRMIATKPGMLGGSDKFNSGEEETVRAALFALAENTGGRALLDSDAFGANAAAALKETFNYYLLAWRPESETQKIEKFRRVEVSILNRPELIVRVPRGFLEPETNAPKKASIQTASLKSTATDLQPAAASFSTKQELPVRISAEFLNTPDNGMVLSASTQIATDALAYGEGSKQSAAIDLAGVVLNEEGSPVSSFGTRLNVDPLTDESPGQSPSVIYNYRAPLKPGIYQLRVAAREDKTGRVGRASQWIEIPDLSHGRLTLSSLFLGGQEIRAGEKRAGASSAPQMQFSVNHRFDANSRLSFFLFIYNAQPAPGGGAASSLTAEIQVMQDKRIALTIPPQKVTTEPSTDIRRIPYGGSFPLRSLRAGSYILRVTVTDRSAQTSATQDVRFHIE
ncbi:MAG TPA: VWA domain-containing protein [Pyrinomonadaceae bacterium]